ncbi:MAG: serine protease [Pseudomonadota bacterium]
MDEKSVKDRLQKNLKQIKHALAVATSGNPYAAEPDRERRISRLQVKAQLSRQEASAIDGLIDLAQEGAAEGALDVASEGAAGDGGQPPPPRPPGIADASGAEKIWGDTVDFVNVSFLEKGARIARAVGRVAFRNGQPQGSGFLIGEGLFLTNHHVVDTAEFAGSLMLQFDYETDLTGSHKQPTSFAIDTTIFITSDDSQDGLDYTLFVVGPRLEGDKPLEYFGWSGLSDASDKHMIGEFANIVQHPRGRFKEVVLRENRLVSRGKSTLHYVADTQPGSSGSPVFNSEWRPIALHHWGSPWADVFDEDGEEIDVQVNEGIRISSIVADIRSKLGELDPTSRARVERALFLGAQPESAGDEFIPDYCDLRASEASMGPTVSADGRLSWTVPVEISVGIPTLAQAAQPAQAAPPNPDPAQEFVKAASTAKAPAARTKAKATRTKSATKRRTRRTSTK